MRLAPSIPSAVGATSLTDHARPTPTATRVGRLARSGCACRRAVAGRHFTRLAKLTDGRHGILGQWIKSLSSAEARYPKLALIWQGSPWALPPSRSAPPAAATLKRASRICGANVTTQFLRALMIQPTPRGHPRLCQRVVHEPSCRCLLRDRTERVCQVGGIAASSTGRFAQAHAPLAVAKRHSAIVVARSKRTS